MPVAVTAPRPFPAPPRPHPALGCASPAPPPPNRSSNPRPLFQALCKAAPRFRGYQQQDSQELLRTLLDYLEREEHTVR